MIGFLAPFFIAFGIGAGIAAVLTILAAVSVTVRELLLLAWGVVKEVAGWPLGILRTLRDTPRMFREEVARIEAEKAKKD
jgi:hypothetical protein